MSEKYKADKGKVYKTDSDGRIILHPDVTDYLHRATKKQEKSILAGHAKHKALVNMGKYPEQRLAAMEKAYRSRGKNVPLRYVKAADRNQNMRHKAFKKSQEAKEAAGHWSIMK